MKTTIKTAIMMLAITFSTQAISQSEGTESQRTHVSLEIDPATFAFGGYSGHLRIQPRGWDHVLIGAGIYAMDMPAPFVDINSENKGMGWNVRINRGVGLFGEYHFKEVNRGFFAGTQVSSQQFKITRDEHSGSERFENILLMGYGGYSLQPFSFPLYFKAWGGLGYTSTYDGQTTLGTETYDVAPISMFATLHVGYTF